MKKYLIYRAPKEIDRDLSKHELVGVEYGEDIDAVTDTIIRTVTDDLSGNPEYSGSEVFAYAPDDGVCNRINVRTVFHSYQLMFA